ncbi:MAG: hypothetical protein Q8K75_12205 [Chlamydiales bacterium]|nr:hypothetical protein [Chlamydiales bacterium]
MFIIRFMTWRNQLRDLAILYSLADDLKLFWQLKATRWEKLEAKVLQAAQQAASSPIVDEEAVAARFKKFLLADNEYKELRFRIKTQIKEVIEMASFLGLEVPDGIQDIRFKPPLPEYDIIEESVESIEHFIPLCRVSSYPYHYVLQAIKTPRKFARACYEFYYGIRDREEASQ